MMLHHFLLFLHLVGVVVWVGGMAFAYLCLRPAATALPPAQRLVLWAGVFERFFPIVWAALALILVSGFVMLGAAGFAHAPKAWHAMATLGLVMGAIFASVFLGPWPRLRAAVAGEDWAKGAGALASIRQRIAINLALAVLTMLVATLGLAF